MTAPLVSIVIPTYNRPRLVGRAIESCLAQTYSNIEILVIDDASSADLAPSLPPLPRVRLIRHDRNRGVSAARNSGVRHAKGELVAFLDSDDAWRPEKLDAQVAATAGKARFVCGTMCEIVAGGSQRVQRVIPKWRKPEGLPLGDYMFLYRVQRSLPVIGDVHGYFAHTSTLLLPRAVALRTPFRTRMTQYEDMAFLIDLDRAGVDFILVEGAPQAIRYDDDRPGRLGSADNLERGRRFLQETGLGGDAARAFQVSHLGHLSETPVASTWRALREGLISPRTAAGVLSRVLVGQRMHRRMKALVGAAAR